MDADTRATSEYPQKQSVPYAQAPEAQLAVAMSSHSLLSLSLCFLASHL